MQQSININLNIPEKGYSIPGQSAPGEPSFQSLSNPGGGHKAMIDARVYRPVPQWHPPVKNECLINSFGTAAHYIARIKLWTRILVANFSREFKLLVLLPTFISR